MSLTLKRPAVADMSMDVAEPTQKSVRRRGRPKAAALGGTRAADGLLVGGEPRVDLLPPEVRAGRIAHRHRRVLGYAVLGVLLLVVAGFAGAAALAVTAQSNLTSAQAETGTLLAQQQKYLEVRRVQDQANLVRAAQQVGASTEIDWQSYLNQVQATLPANVTIDTVNIDSATPLGLYAQATAPLQGARVATISFAAKSPTLPEVPTWLTALAALPGFADATPGSVTLDTTTNVYTVNITMHVNESAYDNRFTPKEK